ncbi:unnamed protein product [Dicrocoelium dendriticum]|nr:unnamed protein product [Dicrocoelium dendriticum]
MDHRLWPLHRADEQMSVPLTSTQRQRKIQLTELLLRDLRSHIRWLSDTDLDKAIRLLEALSWELSNWEYAYMCSQASVEESHPPGRTSIIQDIQISQRRQSRSNGEGCYPPLRRVFNPSKPPLYRIKTKRRRPAAAVSTNESKQLPHT